MRDFPSCFSENAVQIYDSSPSVGSTSKTAQNSVTCIYEGRICGRRCLITVTWSKTLMGLVLTLTIDDYSKDCLRRVDVKPWLFSRRKGNKKVEGYSGKFDVFWDLSSAKFRSSPEPCESFYVAVLVESQMVLLIGDMRKEAFSKAGALSLPLNSTFLAKRENLFAKKVFATKARFREEDDDHEIEIECETTGVLSPTLILRIDCKTVVEVSHLQWKFRGNHTALIEGTAVEFFWDVHNWLFGTADGNAIFMFKARVSEKGWDGHATSSSSSKGLLDSSFGFSLVLYAWKRE